MVKPRLCIFLGAVSLLIVAPSAASAWETQTAITDGCHERLTFLALDRSPWPGDAQPPPSSPDDIRVIGDLPFDLPAANRNIWDVTAALANRAVDLGGYEPDELADLSHWHARPDRQAWHCLRTPSQDGTQGDVQALADCHAHILSQLELALGPDETPDLAVRERNQVYLTFRGTIDALLPRYAYHLGVALHALQDGFSHQFRDPTDLSEVRSVLNYADVAGSPGYDAARDGYQHLGYMDACGSVDELQQRRFAIATEASAALMTALADGTGGRAGRLARAEEVLVRYLSLDHDPGEVDCGAANAWCGATEPELATHWTAATGCAVSAPGARGGGGAGLLASLLLGLGALVAGRRRRWAARAAAALVFVGAAWATAAPRARAEDDEAHDERIQTNVAAQEAQIEAHAEAQGVPAGDPMHRGLGVVLTARGSLQSAALGAALGGRYDVASFLTLGLDVEYNPWLDFAGGGQTTSPGTVNIFATGIVTWGIAQALEIRTTLHLGIAYLLDDLYEAPSGSVGPFIGGAPVGVAIRMGNNLRLIIDPDIMIPIPSIKTVPLARVQYGIALGLQWVP